MTRPRSARRAARTSVLLAAFALAATAAPHALAAEGGAPPLPDASQLAADVIEQVGLGDVLPPLPVEQPLVQPLDVPLEPPAATAQQAAEEPASTGAAAAPPPQPAAAPVAEPPPEPDPPPPPAPAAAVQHEPSNVNVSVRVDSAGDDGAVTQVNVTSESPPPQYQPEAAQYQPAAAEEPAPPQVDQAVAAGVEPAWEWSWTWRCGDADVAPAVVPAGALPQNWIWNWNWNCGGANASGGNTSAQSGAGYHPVPVQYRPVNINISIRINSPGNNGPVVQTNVAVAVTVPAPPGQAPPAQALLPPPVPPAAALPAEAAPAALDPAAPDAAAPANELDGCCLLREPRGVPYAADAQAGALAVGDAAAAPGIASLPADTVAVAARLELQLGVRRSAQAAEPPRPQVRPARPAPPRRGDDEEPTVVMQSGLGLAPLGGPDRSLPFAALALLAFLFASANTSLASVRSSPAPGADADDPPDRPG